MSRFSRQSQDETDVEGASRRALRRKSRFGKEQVLSVRPPHPGHQIM